MGAGRPTIYRVALRGVTSTTGIVDLPPENTANANAGSQYQAATARWSFTKWPDTATFQVHHIDNM